MPRPSVEDVRMELEADGYPIEAITDPQIETVGLTPATLEVDERLADTGMSDDRLKLIERYLAGHFILAAGVDELRQVDSESTTDGASANYARPSTREGGYDETSLGRKALSADTSNVLGDASKPPASITTPDARRPGR
jgi:hypothetical protein